MLQHLKRQEHTFGKRSLPWETNYDYSKGNSTKHKKNATADCNLLGSIISSSEPNGELKVYYIVNDCVVQHFHTSPIELEFHMETT